MLPGRANANMLVPMPMPTDANGSASHFFPLPNADTIGTANAIAKTSAYANGDADRRYFCTTGPKLAGNVKGDSVDFCICVMQASGVVFPFQP